MRRRFVTLIVAMGCIVGFAGCSAAATGPATDSAAIIGPGHGTATVTWRPVTGNNSSAENPPQPFAGTIGGHPLTGVATTPLTSGSQIQFSKPSKSPGEVEVFKYVGKVGGSPFSLGLYLKTPVTLSGSLEAKGTFDGMAVSGTIVPTAQSTSNAGGIQGAFHGTIGRWKVSGTISEPTGTAKRRTAKAVYTVTG